MKRYLAFCLFCFLILLPQFALATPEGDAVRAVDEASVMIRNMCTYTINLKQVGASPVKKIVFSYGNGSLVEHASPPHQVLTAGHVVTCDPTLPEIFFQDNLKREEVVSFSFTSVIDVKYKDFVYSSSVVKAIPAVRRGTRETFLVRPGIFVEYGLLKIDSAQISVNSLEEEDAALLNVILPETHIHGHVPINFEQIYDLASTAVIRGYEPNLGLRLKEGLIEIIGERFLQINSHVYPGMSGSTAYVFKDNKYYGIGIVVATFAQPNIGYVDVTWATRLTKDLADKLGLKTAR